jgi:thioesterase domain-containing protein
MRCGSWESSLARHAPLSFSQEALWLTQEIVPGISQYQMVMLFELAGRLDPALLERSIAVIVRRHELLRSVLGRVANVPSLIASEPAGDILGFADLSGLPAGWARDSAADALVGRWFREPFDLSTAPLLRGEILRLDVRRHMLVLATHHIVSDEVSLGVIQRELSTCYAAFAAGRAPVLPELPVQYADFAAWQRAEIEPGLEAGLGYWEERLRDLPVMRLPADRPRPPARAFLRSWFSLELDPAVIAGLTELARERDTTPFCVLLAAFELLAAWWAGSAEAVVGVPLTGRSEPQTKNLIGFFVNTVVLRARCAPGEPFTELLDRLRREFTADLAHGHVPFHKVVERINPQRDRGRHPLFQTVFHTADEDRDDALSLGDLTVTDQSLRYVRSARVLTEFDLVVQVVVAATRPRVNFQYAAELFDQDTIAELAGRYGRLLASICADPGAPQPAAAFGRAADPAGNGTAACGDAVAGATSSQVLGVLADELGVPDLRLTDEFFAAGGSSAIGARAVARLRTELGLPVTLVDIFEAETIAGLIRACGVALPSGTAEPPRATFDVVTPIRAHGTATPLFCFHPGLGLAWCYRALVGHLPEEIPLFGIQARGIGETEPLPRTLEEMALNYLAHLRRIQPAGPYRLLGWSFGGNVAHAVAVLLAEAGQDVSLLAMLDSWSPASEGFAVVGPPPADGLMDEIMRSYGAEDGLASLTPEHLRYLAEVLANNMALIRAHRPRLFRGDLLYFEACGDDPPGGADPADWSPFVSGTIESRRLSAGHYEMLQPESAAVAARALTERLRG